MCVEHNKKALPEMFEPNQKPIFSGLCLKTRTKVFQCKEVIIYIFKTQQKKNGKIV